MRISDWSSDVCSSDLAGGAGGDGGNISLTQKANIVTSGAGANAVLIQSIGGGGGFISSIGSSIDAPLMVGATDGATGDGGAVKVATHGIIQTSGAGSTGLIVQSIGGGGGAAVAVDADGLVREPIVEQANAAPAPRTMLRSFAAASVPQGAGSGGAVDVTIGAAIHTTGDQANGVIVQSVGGGGALGGSASGALAGGRQSVVLGRRV